MQPWWKEPTRPQWATFTAAWLGWVLDAFDFTIYLLVMPKIAKEFGVSTTATAGLITLTLLVRLLGGFAAGAAADRWGRKLPFMISVAWFAVCDGAIAFAPSFAWVLVLRTLFGFGMGAEWTSGMTLAMENWPERSRGIASGILQGSWAIGYLLAAIAAAWIEPRYGWRGMFLVAALPALLVLPIRIWVPESPEWKRQQTERAHAPMRELLHRDVFVRLVWASTFMAAGFGIYYGMSGLWPTLLTQLGRNDIPQLVALFNIGLLGGAVAIGVLAARRGIVLALAIPIPIALVSLPLYVGYEPQLLWLGALIAGACGVGGTGLVPKLLTSLFAPAIRARSVGLVYHLGAMFAAFIPTGIAALHEHYGVPLADAIALVTAACGLALLALLPFYRALLGSSEHEGEAVAHAR